MKKNSENIVTEMNSVSENQEKWKKMNFTMIENDQDDEGMKEWMKIPSINAVNIFT